MELDRALVARVALALGIGTICGWIANRAGMPLPWMLGPMIGNTLASVFRLPVAAPLRLRPLMIPVIGVLLGSSLRPELVQQAGQWLATLFAMPVFLCAAGALSFLFYRRVAGYDRVTAFFSAMPGGLNDMLILGGEAGGDERKIALAHASRILIVVLLVGFYFGLVLDVRSASAGGNWTDVTALSLLDAFWLIAAGVFGIGFGKLLHLPAAAMLGPMILSGAAHLSGLVALPPPSIFVVAAQIVLGTIIGCRFAGVELAEIGRNLGLGLVSSVLMILAAIVAAWAVSAASGVDQAQAFLAYSPGGLTEMSLLAIAMGQEPAYVSMAHLARIMMVIGGAPVLFGRWGRRR